VAEQSSSPAARWTVPIRQFTRTETSGAAVLLAATLLALGWANSPWASSYEAFWHTPLGISLGAAELTLDLRHWVNDGLMALFFFVAGLEIRRELDMGELRERRRLATPVVAALGGMVVPAAIYLSLNAGGPSARGWGVVIATDTAFALGVLALVGGAAPRVRTFLLTMVVVDDVIALTVIAVAYTEDLSVPPLLAAGALLGLTVAMRRMGVRNGIAYFLVGTAMWLATLLSGVHATVAGVAMGVLASAYPPSQQALTRAAALWRLFREEPTPQYARQASRTLERTISPNERLQLRWHPWTSYVIVPVFALANAGVTLTGESVRAALDSPITYGIVAGLVVGKLVGIVGATWLSGLPRLGGLPLTIPWLPLLGVGSVAGIGFTVSLLVADISFTGDDLDAARIGVLAASLLASCLSLAVFGVGRVLPERLRAAGGRRVAPPLRDLAEVVDPEVDHVLGDPDAPLVLVEYGDFECPYCGRAQPVVRELVERFGDDLAVVFRHLPLVDVHEHAQTAAEAAEAAAAQGQFWQLHDAMFAHPDALDLDGLAGLARELGLDADRLVRDVEHRRHATRVARDVASAAESGAAGTPTFFVNGRRHTGGLDVDSLDAALRTELASLAVTGRR
jgi:Na+/H+ antiporter NhaA